MSQTNYIHLAPAGTRYNSISHAGRILLESQCSGFLAGTSHAMLPPIFRTKLPEPVDGHGKITAGETPTPSAILGYNKQYEARGLNFNLLQRATKDQLQGATDRKRGETFETLIFNRFEHILNPRADFQVSDCQLLWQGVKI